MLGFTLSKLNLLILVVALFSIIAYFMFSLDEIVKQNQAQLLTSKLVKNASTTLSTATSCDRVVINLPRYLTSIGTDRLYYKLKISSADNDDDPFNGNALIFSVSSIRDPDSVLGADAVRSQARIKLFYLEDTWKEQRNSREGVLIDPQGLPPFDSIAVIKRIEVEDEKPRQVLYVIPCSVPAGTSTQSICASEISSVAAAAGFGETGTKGSLGEFQC